MGHDGEAVESYMTDKYTKESYLPWEGRGAGVQMRAGRAPWEVECDCSFLL